MRLSWSKIRDIYEGEWIEVVDYDWPWNRSTPNWGVIRYHHPDRAELLRLIQSGGKHSDSLVLHIASAQIHLQLDKVCANL